MKDIVEFLSKKKYIFKKFEKIDNKTLGTKKRVEIYKGVDINSFYVAVFVNRSKSRFIMKNANDSEELFEKLKDISGHNYKKKVLLISSKICSKSESFLKEKGWKIYAFV
ncbi:MAG: hypothetical protein GXO12_04655 [Epsilonproteobacteria bacterium]|nr:hypothetical protein [Campylobacterota bacterium]